MCGLCGNNNGDLKDDFITRHSSEAIGALEFGNSWKTSQKCADTLTQNFPCDSNPYCKAWAVQKCEIIRDSIFKECHHKVVWLWKQWPHRFAPRDSCAVLCLGGPRSLLRSMYWGSLLMWHGGEVFGILHGCGHVRRGLQCSWSLCHVEKTRSLS